MPKLVFASGRVRSVVPPGPARTFHRQASAAACGPQLEGPASPPLGRRVLSAYTLKLYVTGTSPRAKTAIDNLRRICEQDLSGEYTVEIIDVLEQPEIAETNRILATPTLIKELPPPLRRVIGDLSDREKVLLGLELRKSNDEGGKPAS
jgi:circadian clock protein KaiB